MKKILFIQLFITLLFLISGCTSQKTNDNCLLFKDGLAIVYNRKDGKELYGYVNKDFEEVIQCQYTQANTFHNGRAIVRLQSGDEAIINKNGDIISDLYWNITYINYLDTYIGYTVDDEHVLLNNKLEPVKKFKDIGIIFPSSYDNYILPVQFIEGSYGYIDLNGNVLMDGLTSMPNYFVYKYTILIDNDNNLWTIDTNFKKLHNFGNVKIDMISSEYILIDNKVYNYLGNLVYEETRIEKKCMLDDNILVIKNKNVNEIYEEYEIVDLRSKRKLSVKSYFRIADTDKIFVFKDKKIIICKNNLKQIMSKEIGSAKYSCTHDNYRGKLYIKLYYENEKTETFLVNISTRKFKKIDFIKNDDKIVEVYKNYILVKNGYSYKLLNLKGKVILEDEHYRFYATDDGYIINFSGQIYNKKLKLLFDPAKKSLNISMSDVFNNYRPFP